MSISDRQQPPPAPAPLPSVSHSQHSYAFWESPPLSCWLDVAFFLPNLSYPPIIFVNIHHRFPIPHSLFARPHHRCRHRRRMERVFDSMPMNAVDNRSRQPTKVRGLPSGPPLTWTAAVIGRVARRTDLPCSFGRRT